jgi:hypothetical protein
LGAWLLAAPEGWTAFYDGINQWWYRVLGGDYETSWMRRALRSLIRICGFIAIGVGSLGFILGIVLLAGG